jgi:hypothetical protein
VRRSWSFASQIERNSRLKSARVVTSWGAAAYGGNEVCARLMARDCPLRSRSFCECAFNSAFNTMAAAKAEVSRCDLSASDHGALPACIPIDSNPLAAIINRSKQVFHRAGFSKRRLRRRSPFISSNCSCFARSPLSPSCRAVGWLAKAGRRGESSPFSAKCR